MPAGMVCERCLLLFVRSFYITLFFLHPTTLSPHDVVVVQCAYGKENPHGSDIERCIFYVGTSKACSPTSLDAVTTFGFRGDGTFCFVLLAA